MAERTCVKLGPQDYVICSLKAHQAYQSAPLFASLFGPRTPVVTAMNGIPWWYFQEHGGPLDGLILESVDPGGVIARSLPAAAAMGCVVYCSASIVKPGVVRHHEGTRFSLGEPDRTESERSRMISNVPRCGAQGSGRTRSPE